MNRLGESRFAAIILTLVIRGFVQAATSEMEAGYQVENQILWKWGWHGTMMMCYDFLILINSPNLGWFIESEHFVELGRWSWTGSKRNCKVTVKSNHIFLERFDWWTLCHTDFDDKPHQFSQRKYADCVCVCADWFSGITDTICWGFPEETRKTVNPIQSRCFGKIDCLVPSDIVLSRFCPCCCFFFLAGG